MGDAEGMGDGHREYLDDDEHEHRDGGCRPDAVPQRLANAIDVVSAVVEAEQRLQGDGDADERHDRELPNALHHANGRQRVVGADGRQGPVFHQLEVDDEVHDGHARLHAEARQPEGENGAIHGKAQAHGGQAQPHGNVAAQAEVLQHCQTRTGPAEHRGQSAAHDPPAERQNEQGVKGHRAHQTDDHGAERPVRGAAGADEVVHAKADALQDKAGTKDLDERLGVGAHLRRGARQIEHPGDQRRIPPDDEHNDGSNETQGHHIAQGALGIVALALAEAQGRQRVAAVADEHGDGHEHDHDGVGHRHGRQPDLPYRMSQKHRVDDGIGAVDEHAHHRRNGELRNEPRNGGRPHPQHLVVTRRRGAQPLPARISGCLGVHAKLALALRSCALFQFPVKLLLVTHAFAPFFSSALL